MSCDYDEYTIRKAAEHLTGIDGALSQVSAEDLSPGGVVHNLVAGWAQRFDQHPSATVRAALTQLLPLSHDTVWAMAHDENETVRTAAVHKHALTTPEYWELFTQDDSQEVQRAALNVAGADFDAAALYTVFRQSADTDMQYAIMVDGRFSAEQYASIISDKNVEPYIRATAFSMGCVTHALTPARKKTLFTAASEDMQKRMAAESCFNREELLDLLEGKLDVETRAVLISAHMTLLDTQEAWDLINNMPATPHTAMLFKAAPFSQRQVEQLLRNPRWDADVKAPLCERLATERRVALLRDAGVNTEVRAVIAAHYLEGVDVSDIALDAEQPTAVRTAILQSCAENLGVTGDHRRKLFADSSQPHEVRLAAVAGYRIFSTNKCIEIANDPLESEVLRAAVINSDFPRAELWALLSANGRSSHIGVQAFYALHPPQHKDA